MLAPRYGLGHLSATSPVSALLVHALAQAKGFNCKRTFDIEWQVAHVSHCCDLLLDAVNTVATWMQVEKSWDEVVKAFPPPLLRHRYGS